MARGGLTDAAGGLLVLLLAAALGVAARYRHIVRTQQLDRMRSREREMLARELHDTVAHHVTAITIQAQAGRFLAESRDLGGATSALVVIEEEATRALSEMRAMVESLRGGHAGRETPPARSVADVDDLARPDGTDGLRVEVERRGPLDDLRPSDAAPLHRIAQESITNAERHADRATGVRVLLDGDAEGVRLRVTDDGVQVLAHLRPHGYGLVGMAERASLLGGRFCAGPDPAGGWTVQVFIPRRPERR